MKIYITGIAGFIGYHLACRLREKGIFVVGCDTFNTYYDPTLKRLRANHLKKLGVPIDKINCIDLPQNLNRFSGVTHIIHLAAQAGVRYSLTHPESYIENNIRGTFSVLEVCKKLKIPLLFASSSSVYGLNKKLPFSEEDKVDNPANLYAATKLSTEHLAFSYHSIYGIPMCGLRFFTVYGTYGRPDMAYFSFAEKIVKEEPLALFNEGKMKRDFTHISDIVEGIERALAFPFTWEIFNLGNNRVEPLSALIQYLEKGLGKKAQLNLLPMQPGEMLETYADISKAASKLGYAPKVCLEEGIAQFTEWFLTWKKKKKQVEALQSDLAQ